MITSNMLLSDIATALRGDVVHLQRHVAGRYAEMECGHRRNGKGVLTQCGEWTSPAGVQWLYVLIISTTRTILYPMAWYFTREGIHGIQLEAKGPLTHLRPHVLDQYRDRFCPDVSVMVALRQLHWRNYDKASGPHAYQGKPGIASAVVDGYLMGNMLYNDTVVRMHTFYDMEMGMKRPDLREMRQLVEWRRYYGAMSPKAINADTGDYLNWGRGFPLRLARLRRAA